MSYWKKKPIYPVIFTLLLYGILPSTLSSYLSSFLSYFKSVTILVIVIGIIIIYSRIDLYRINKKRKELREKQSENISTPFTKTYRGLIVSISKINDAHLFEWNEVPGDDEGLLTSYLKKNCNINWEGDAHITKPDAGNTIFIKPRGHEVIKIMIDEKRGKGNLNIGNNKIISLKVKEENGKLVIYSDEKSEIEKIIDNLEKHDTENDWNELYNIRGIGQTFRAIKYHIGNLEVCWMLYTKESKESKELVEYFIRKFDNNIKPEPILIEWPFDMKYIYRIINDLYINKVGEANLKEKDIIADITGGTTPMSGAILLARNSDRDIQYVDQEIIEVIDIKPV